MQIKITRYFIHFIVFFGIGLLFAQTVPQTSNLIAYYPLFENANDISGNNYNGVIFNNPTLVANRFGTSNSAYFLDGEDDFIYFGDEMYASLPDTDNDGFYEDSFSISIWAKSSSNSTESFIAFGVSDGLYTGLISRMESNNQVSFNSSNWGFNTHTSGRRSDGNWHHYVFVYTAGSSRKVFIDGDLTGVNSDISRRFRFKTYGLSIGRERYIPNQDITDLSNSTINYTGSVDDVRLWNIALSDAEVASLFNYENNSTNDYSPETSWDGSQWDKGTPSINSTAVIAVDYLESTNLICNKLVVNSGIKINVYKTLNVGSSILNNGQIIFKSDVTGDGYLDEFTGTISGTGTVITEKYYPAKRAFRMVASPISGGSIFDNWQDAGASNTGIGTHITGEVGTVGQHNTTTGLDYTQSGNPSLFGFNGSWQMVTNTKTTNLTVGVPYRLMVRGDRTPSLLQSNDATPNPTTLVSTGNLEVGTKNITFPSATAGGTTYAFIANPYQSRIDMSDVLSANTNTDNTKLWVWDPMVNDRGTFILIDELSGNGTATPASTATKFIEPGQALFIQTTEESPSITFTESMKDVSSLSLSPESLSQQPQLLFNLQDENQEVIDAIRLRFTEDTDNGIDALDVVKMGNLDENLASVNENSLFTIQRRNFPENDEVIPLFTNNWRNENYSFTANLNNLGDTNVYLVDHYLGTETLITNGEAYSFSVDTNISESVNSLRFALKFNTETMSIEEQENTFFSLYPNPARDVVNIQTSLALGSQVNIQIYNMLGQLMLSQKQTLKASSLQVDVHNYPSGIYMVKLTNETGNKQAQQLIKE
ncbi:LamG-like jellyroll fold domain-containing protein [Psychroflexus salis]|uniref:Secretion system C-terminal sorting domain-containing protein n=1 Tax=Psychroflexus salis TaxID=1526574 RepID=A0A917A3D8_9FLAO|nr:LamG-like jellyroll fold domain-containing protein [Psychroflexus salis]GGE22105.1 hypothetical protein GCM10010831_23950 [Psychroflexus salis]